jgi:pyrroloquinoline quinone (PQQ) biosynthesis protein C
MTTEEIEQYQHELYDLLTRFGNAIGIKTHSIYAHEYENTTIRAYDAYQAIQAACIEMDNYASEE